MFQIKVWFCSDDFSLKHWVRFVGKPCNGWKWWNNYFSTKGLESFNWNKHFKKWMLSGTRVQRFSSSKPFCFFFEMIRVMFFVVWVFVQHNPLDDKEQHTSQSVIVSRWWPHVLTTLCHILNGASCKLRWYQQYIAILAVSFIFCGVNGCEKDWKHSAVSPYSSRPTLKLFEYEIILIWLQYALTVHNIYIYTKMSKFRLVYVYRKLSISSSLKCRTWESNPQLFKLLSWEVPYPLPRHFWRSFSLGGRC